MNVWLGSGLFLNVFIGFVMFRIDSFGLVKSSVGLEKLLALPSSLWLLRVGMALWFLALFISCIGGLLVALHREKQGGWLLLFGGLVFFPIGMVQVYGAILILERLKEQSFVEECNLPVSNETLDATVWRKRVSSLFDMGLGGLLSLGALGLVYYTNTQHFYRQLPSTIPKGLLLFSRPNELSSSYVMLGLVLLFSFYVLTLLAVVLAYKFSFFVVWKTLSAAFLSGPLVPFAFAFGLLLLFWGVHSFRYPLLQLHEHYFTLRVSWFGKVYALYKDIQQVESDEKKQLRLQVGIAKQTKTFSLPVKHLKRVEFKQLLGQLEQRKKRQHRHVY